MPTIDRNVHSKLPMNELGFVGVFWRTTNFLDRKQGKFIESVDAIARHKIGLQHLSDQPVSSMLHASKGKEKDKRKILVIK